MKFNDIKYFAILLFINFVFLNSGYKKEIDPKENHGPLRIVGEMSSISEIKLINGSNEDLLIFGNNLNNNKLLMKRVDKNFKVLSDTLLGEGFNSNEFTTSWGKLIYDKDINIVIGAKFLSDYKNPNNVAGCGFSAIYKFSRRKSYELEIKQLNRGMEHKPLYDILKATNNSIRYFLNFTTFHLGIVS